MISVRAMTAGDIPAVAALHRQAFPRQLASEPWISCNFAAHPRMMYFVAEAKGGEVMGYIHWSQKSGFRPEVVLELEQLAVAADLRGQGIGALLIRASLPMVQEALNRRRARIKHLIVTTRADNAAQRLYRRVLGAEVDATISNLYSADEVVMIARHIDLQRIAGQLPAHNQQGI